MNQYVTLIILTDDPAQVRAVTVWGWEALLSVLRETRERDPEAAIFLRLGKPGGADPKEFSWPNSFHS